MKQVKSSLFYSIYFIKVKKKFCYFKDETTKETEKLQNEISILKKRNAELEAKIEQTQNTDTNSISKKIKLNEPDNIASSSSHQKSKKVRFSSENLNLKRDENESNQETSTENDHSKMTGKPETDIISEHSELDDNLDTKKVALDFKNYVTAQNLSMVALAKQPGWAPRQQLSNLINHPRPWSECTDLARQMYKKMNELTKKEPGMCQTSLTTKFRRSFSALHSNLVYNSENNAKPLDPLTIAMNVGLVLRRHGISYCKLAEKYLGVGQTRLKKYLRRPKPWSECSEFLRGVYRCLRDLTVSDEQIELLKSL